MTDRGSAGAKKQPPSRLAKAVRLERDRKGWTSERLADAAGVSHSWVRNFEAGIIQNPGADRLRAMEEALGLRTGELYAASIPVPYDTLVRDILAGQDARKAPWEELLENQELILEAVATLSSVLAGPEAADAASRLLAHLEDIRRQRSEAAHEEEGSLSQDESARPMP